MIKESYKNLDEPELTRRITQKIHREAQNAIESKQLRSSIELET